ncbi:MAG: hypothetical protein IT423_22580 [Pirellulaceae bacterium]|nr:hypothetical protein [Pirellulaceae bacterium]
MRWMTTLICAVALLSVQAGCNTEKGPRKYDISGTVKFDGQDIVEGEIVFQPQNESIGAEGGVIKDGRYSMKAREGVNQVQVRATRVVPGKKGPLGEDWVEQFIPEQYNDQSTLTAEVGSGKTKHDFDMKK